MMIITLITTYVSLVIFLWLASTEDDNWLVLEAKIALFTIVTVIAYFLYDDAFWGGVPIISGIILLVFLVLNHLPGLKKAISGNIIKVMKSKVPRISDTEKEVIDSGDLSWEKDLFYGNYTQGIYENAKFSELSAEERSFFNKETEELCRICSPQALAKHRGLPPEAFDYIKKHKFWGMIIPRKYGGLDFSAAAQGAIIGKLATRSPALAVMVMVPNSLGPGELIMHYGSQAQKDKYLAKLARGEEIPCFALTSQKVGSDATSLEDYGILVKKKVAGKDVLGFNLNFSKRYISLSPIATVIGVAFRAYDPDGLLGTPDQAPPKSKGGPLAGDLGITCALVARETPGVSVGRRHNPLDILFHNGPVSGKDVFVPLDNIIGGKEHVGKGWQMLVDCLSIGRGISLPSLAKAGTQIGAFTSAAYASLREQFGMPVGKFEGVGEQLGRLALNSYLVQALSENACTLVDQDLKPAVSSAIAKYYTTDKSRAAAIMAMDIHGGKAIMGGPKNYLTELYKSVPIGITVEGANILTRSMIVFGQGFLRCHPFLRDEAFAILDQDKKAFHKLIWQHAYHIIKISARAYFSTWSPPWFFAPGVREHGKHQRRLAGLSAKYAYLVELVLMFIGGDIKRKEAISGRFADSWSAMQTAVACMIKYKHDKDGDPQLLDTTLQQLEHQAQQALLEICDNFPGGRGIRAYMWLTKTLLFPLGNHYKKPRDQELLGLAKKMGDPDWVLKNLAPDIYFPKQEKDEPLAQLRAAFSMKQEADEIRQKVKEAKLPKADNETMELYAARLVKQKIITAAERKTWLSFHEKVQEIIAVDDFAFEEV